MLVVEPRLRLKSSAKGSGIGTSLFPIASTFCRPTTPETPTELLNARVHTPSTSFPTEITLFLFLFFFFLRRIATRNSSKFRSTIDRGAIRRYCFPSISLYPPAGIPSPRRSIIHFASNTGHRINLSSPSSVSAPPVSRVSFFAIFIAPARGRRVSWTYLVETKFGRALREIRNK